MKKKEKPEIRDINGTKIFVGDKVAVTWKKGHDKPQYHIEIVTVSGFTTTGIRWKRHKGDKYGRARTHSYLTCLIVEGELVKNGKITKTNG
mgnify:CR=1 FL=1|tara:strand:- start:395 stop:667 length:273 start_codon:yes stop_codon:yes gene_type:complete